MSFQKSGDFLDDQRNAGGEEKPRPKSRVTVYGEELKTGSRIRGVNKAKRLLDLLYALSVDFDLFVADGEQIVTVTIPLDVHDSSPSVGGCGCSHQPTEGEARKGHDGREVAS